MDGRVKVKLGDDEYVVVPQRIGYLTNALGPELQATIEATSTDDGFAAVVGNQAHGFLSKLIPGFMPLWKFRGFASKDAMIRGEYVREADQSPSPAEIANAINTVATVSLGEAKGFLTGLLGSVGPALKEQMIALAVASISEQVSQPQPNSPLPSGASDQTSSGTAHPTSTAPTSD